jgi:hypothetical protein
MLLETIDWPDERVLNKVIDDVVTRLSPIKKDDMVDKVPATRMNPATCRFETKSVCILRFFGRRVPCCKLSKELTYRFSPIFISDKAFRFALPIRLPFNRIEQNDVTSPVTVRPVERNAVPCMVTVEYKKEDPITVRFLK